MMVIKVTKNGMAHDHEEPVKKEETSSNVNKAASIPHNTFNFPTAVLEAYVHEFDIHMRKEFSGHYSITISNDGSKDGTHVNYSMRTDVDTDHDTSLRINGSFGRYDDYRKSKEDNDGKEA